MITYSKIVFWVFLGLASSLSCADAKESHSKLKIPVIEVKLDQTVSQVQTNSSFKFSSAFLKCKSGGELVTTPHNFIYHDEFLNLYIKNAAGLPSLPTTLGCDVRLNESDPESTIYTLSVHLLPDYDSLRMALRKAKELSDNLLSQGFVVVERPWKSRFNAYYKNAPIQLDTFEDIESAFLTSPFFAEEATLYEMKKGNISLNVLMVNMRRHLGSRVDETDSVSMGREVRSLKEAQSMTKEDLLNEKNYTLSLNIGNSTEWRKVRAAARDAEKKKMR